MQIVPVLDTFSQSLNVILGGQSCTVKIYQKSTRTPAVGTQQGPAAGAAALGPAGPGISIQGNQAIVTSQPATISGLREVFEVGVSSPTFATSATQTNAGALWPIMTGIDGAGIHVTDGSNYGTNFAQLRGDGNSYQYDLATGAFRNSVAASAVQAAWGSRSQSNVGPAGSGFAISRTGYGAFGTSEQNSVCFSTGLSTSSSTTIVLLPTDGTSTLANAIVDPAGNTWTANGGLSAQASGPFGSGAGKGAIAGFSNSGLGSSTSIQTPDKAEFSGISSDLTMQLWIFMTANPSSTPFHLIEKRNNANFGGDNTPYAMYIDTNGTVNFSWASTTLYNIYDFHIAGTTVVTLNTWHHIALVKSGSNFTLYLDGNAEGTASSLNACFTNTRNLIIGAADEQSHQSFTGAIAMVRIDLHADYLSNFTPPTSPLGLLGGGGSNPSGGYVVVTSGYATGTATYLFDCLPCLVGNPNVTTPFTVQGVYPCADGAHIVILTANASDAAPLQWNVVKVTGGVATLITYGTVPNAYWPTIAGLSGDFSDSAPNNTTQFKGCLDVDLQTLWLWEGGASANGLSILQLTGGTATLLFSTASVFANSGLLGPGAMFAENAYGAFIRSNTLSLWTIGTVASVQTARSYFGVSAGSYYWEVQPTSINTSGVYRIGIATAAFPLSGTVAIGSDMSAASVGWSYTGSVFYNGVQLVAEGTYPFNVNDILGFAFNASAGTLTLYRNGNFVFTVTGIAPNTWYPAMSASAIGSATVFNLGANSFVYASPTAYASLFADTTSNTDGADALYLDLFVNDAPVITGVVCQNLNRLVRLSYLGFSGDLMWQDTHGTNDPTSPGLGTRYQLCYVESTDSVPALP
jgi:Concanavalin A-like lectin/glucanases superfamily/SPRY domain